MDKYIDARFERVERALATLVDSIAKYNPSAGNANDLAVAQGQLREGLEQVKRHQTNQLRIQRLNAQTADLDSQIKTILISLASTRKDLTSTPATVFPSGPSNEIRYSELLSYARRISKTTLPPPGTASPFDNGGGVATQDGTASPADAAPTPAATTPGGGATPLPAATNGAPTPVPPQTPTAGTTTPGGAGATAAAAAAAGLLPASQAATTTSSSAQLPEYMGSYLNPQTAFLPWPSVDQIRRGGLAANQVLLHRGVDLRAYDPEAEETQARAAADAEREREQAAEEERARREAAARARHVEINASMAAAAAGSGADGPMSAIPRSSVSGPGEKGQFQFMQDDDDDDDDD